MSSLREAYDGREPPKQKKRRKKRRHGKPTEVEAQAAAATAAAENSTKSDTDQAMPASKKSKRLNRQKSQKTQEPPVQVVNALVPEKMSGGQIMAIAVGNRQLLVKVPMNCQSLDGLRIEVPPVLAVDLPAVREEEEADQGHEHSKQVANATADGQKAAGSSTNQPSCLLFAAPTDPSESDSKSTTEGNAAPCFEGVGIAGAIKLARQQALREYTVRLSAVSKYDGPDFAQTLDIATAQARVVGGKYRYGSVLVSGADFCPAVSGGSNYAKYGRKKIHAELASLKGLSPQAILGKDMVLARLAPTDKFCSFAKQGKISAATSDGKKLIEKEKLLNARPCANCQAALVRRGVRRCFFTRGHGLLGVLELNVFASKVEKLN